MAHVNFIIEDNTTHEGNFYICSLFESGDLYSGYKNVFDHLQIPKTWGSDYKKAIRIVQSENERSEIKNAKDFAEFLIVHSGIGQRDIKKITSFNYPNEE